MGNTASQSEVTNAPANAKPGSPSATTAIGGVAGAAAAGAAGAAGEEEDEATKVSKMFPMQALFYACDKGDPELVRRAFDAGADVNTPDNGPDRDPTKKEEDDELFKDAVITGDYALHKSAEKGFFEVVKLLFFLQADVEAKNRLGSTPLHRAVSQNKREVVEFLISKGAKIEATTLIGNNTLHIAAYLGLVDIAKMILDSRPDAWRLLERPNNAQMTPMDYARKKQVQELFRAYHRPAPSEPGSQRNSARQLTGYTSQQSQTGGAGGAGGARLTMPDGTTAAVNPLSPANGVSSATGVPAGSRLSVDGAKAAAAAAGSSTSPVRTIGGLTSSSELDEKEHDVQVISNPNIEAVVEMPIEEVSPAKSLD